MLNTKPGRQNLRLIGANPPRNDVYEKVTGSATYADDIQFGKKLLHARTVRSPHPHALIKSIDTTDAENLYGVKAIITGKDIPWYQGSRPVDETIFALDRVRFVGEPVAAVAAISEEIATKACELIKVEYEPLEGVFDPEFGASEKAPLIHPRLDEYECPTFLFPKPGTNVANHFKLRRGDCEAAWEECTHIVESTFYLPHIQHVPLETHVAIAQMDQRGKITLWLSSQSPFMHRKLIAKALNISPSDVRVIAPFVGGGFGSKSSFIMEAIPVALANKCKGFPIKFVLTREEEFYTNMVRQGVTSYIKVGCDKDGKILSLKSTHFWDGGASTEFGANVTRAGGYSSTGPFNIPNVETDSICVYTNHPLGGAYRGYGMAEIHTSLNQAIDELAEKAGFNRIDFLKKNAIAEGDIIAHGMMMHANGIQQCIDNVANSIQFNLKEEPSSPDRLRGKGIAIMWKAPAQPENAGSSAWVQLSEDGKVIVGFSGQEMGQGIFTAMAQITADTLGVAYEDVRIAGPVDTQYSPYDWTSGASRLTWSTGNAVKAAALDIRQQIFKIISEAWNESPENLDIVDGIVISCKSGKNTPLTNMVIYGMPKPNGEGWIGGPIIGRGSFMPHYLTGLDPDTGQGPRAVAHYTVGCEGVDIEIEKNTGKVHVIKAAASFDVGKAINPALVKGQIEGGFVQGLSSALFEEIRLRNGVMANPSFTDYRIATTVDTAFPLDTTYVEVPQDDGPFGARGVGEHPMIPTISALGNAIYAATGIRFERAPFSAERIYLAMVDASIVE